MNNETSSSFEISSQNKPANPCILVIFGITGDLTKRLLYPSICNLGSNGLLDKNFCIVGVAIEPFTTESFRTQLKKNVNEFIADPAMKKFGLALADHVYYLSGDFSDANLYVNLKNELEKLVLNAAASKNYLFYFAIPPEWVETVATELNNASLLKEKNDYFRRVVIEKPFGHDLASAKQLNKQLLTFLNEDQIFRIDHFLGKETVQNLLTLRFSNGMFEPIWNRLYINQVQITVAETLGVELRGNYYEKTGALRDMIPNHLLQMLSLITMEPPLSFSAKEIHAEKMKVLEAIQLTKQNDVLQNAVRGQYGPGEVNGEKVVGYRSEKNVSPESLVETYAALRLFIDNWRWLHVPFYLRTGKRMSQYATEIIIQYKSGPSHLFTGLNQNVQRNLLKIYIQPDEGISIVFNSKIPGPILRLDQVEMKFKYSDYFGIKPATGYETILYDCMNGEHLLFKQADMVELGWAIVQPFLDVWNSLPPRDFPNYAAGSEGPHDADTLLEKDGRKWIL